MPFTDAIKGEGESSVNAFFLSPFRGADHAMLHIYKAAYVECDKAA